MRPLYDTYTNFVKQVGQKKALDDLIDQHIGSPATGASDEPPTKKVKKNSAVNGVNGHANGINGH